MIKSVLSFIFLFFLFSLNAQLSIVHVGDTDELNGQIYSKVANGTGDQEIDLHIMNNSGADLSLKITRLKLSVPETDWIDYICWGIIGDPFGGTCYNPSTANPWTTSGQAKLIPNGQGGLLAVHIDPSDEANGTGHYRYYVSEDGFTYLDSVDVIVTSNSLSIKENKQSLPLLTAYPNPSSEILTVSLNNNADGYLKITDVLGKVILEEKISGTKKINVEEFKNGVYILSLTSNGTKTSKRIVIKH
jgi:hypothetical protein